MASLVDNIEFYGALVASGEVSSHRAVASLVAESNGGLTACGASTVLDWQGIRARYAQVVAAARAALRQLEDGGL